ncbi:hypothetical protein [Mucilaginibacter pedocola]|uniref:Thiamine diphosphokinase n=1 Tax=Mucilaginibacter pedocola TaxID=1792845 RepID=A0A1S9PAC6_9SPHI|nr:hypothetical protein [Mucilaginibacter pedocola]OOQ57538.1 hypothetical protein BC343_12060 [Mucilaginibacter pedocola]
MSSHHIVREKQEPALLILGLASFDDELLGQLLEWSPTVITTPDTAEQINAFGIKVDMMVADEADIDLQSDVKLISQEAGSIVDAALDYLISAGYSAVNIVADEFTMEDIWGYADKINIVVFCEGRKVFAVTSGFSKWKPGGETIEILSAATNLRTEGLEPAGDGKYTTIEDGFYALHFDGVFLFIAEEL